MTLQEQFEQLQSKFTDLQTTLESKIKDLQNEIVILKQRGAKKHSFENSPYYEYDIFRNTLFLKGWDDTTIQHYYKEAKGYSEANGGKYLNWITAVENWHRRDITKKLPIKESKFNKINEAIR